MTHANDSAMPTDVWCESRNGGFYQEGTDPGLTKRELFAAMAMQGHLANESVVAFAADSNEIAMSSVIAADALIEALNKEAK